MNVVFMGMKHCGKTTCARALSIKLKVPFVDTDQLMSDIYYKKYEKSMTAKEIFAEFGSDYFKELEAESVKILADDLKNSKEQTVIALGGGTPMNGNIVDELKNSNCLVVYLKSSPEVIFSRVVNSGFSRFLEGDNPLDNFIKISNEREPIYQNYADIVIDADRYKSVYAMENAVNKIVCERLKQEN